MDDIQLKHKKKSFLSKLKGLFEEKKRRPLMLLLFILPFLIAICIFGVVTYKEAKNIINVAKGTETTTNDEYSISSMSYTLRDDATDYQKECFAELKQAIEVTGADDKTIAGLVAKNFIADFYTWTNKQGQYDVGGMKYVCDSKTDTDISKYNENLYLKARDGFYKYLNNYIEEYGSENLIEVNGVTITSCEDLGYPYSLYELKETILQDDGDLERIYDNVDHEAYYVKLNWSYNPETKMDLSQFATSINMIVIKADDRFEIVEMSNDFIDARQLEDDEIAVEE